MQSVLLDELNRNGFCVCTTDGDSMEPFLSDHRDAVVIRKTQPGERLKKYDVPMYVRDGGQHFILHRIIRVRKDDYVIIGDNRRHPEYGITDANIVGVLAGVKRKGRDIDLNSHSYRFYVRFWYFIFPLRWIPMTVRDAFRKLRSGINRMRSRTGRDAS